MGFLAMIKVREKDRCLVIYLGEPRVISSMRQDFTHIEYFRWNDFIIKKEWERASSATAVTAVAVAQWASAPAAEIRRNAVF